jgi:signal transduction histidine kinase
LAGPGRAGSSSPGSGEQVADRGHQDSCRALGDPSLALAYWYPAESRYVDSDGRPVELPEPGAARSSTLIERDGQPVATVIHDPALHYNSALVDSVCAEAGLSLDNERLAAELRAKLAELQASRARLVQTADTERHRIERNLHDGAQQQLVSLKIALGLARQLVTSLPEAAELLTQAEHQAAEALEDLRELARGIYPPLLADLGLRAALEAQGRKAAIPVTIEAEGSPGTRSRSRRPSTSASWKRCRTPPSTHRHQRPR